MANRIVLVSDDSDFFEYIRPKLELRKSDELFTFRFDDIPEKIHLIEASVIIINSESASEKTLSLLKILKALPAFVCVFNEDETFRRKCYRAGAFDYISILMPDSEFRARMIPALTIASILEKNLQYRSVLVEKNIIDKTNEVYIDYEYIIDKELEIIHSSSKKAVFMAISPSEKSKFLVQSNLIETILLNNIRKNDVLMTYAANKYFLFLYDITLEGAQKLWSKIESNFNEKIFAGFVSVSNQKRQQLINEVLNKLHLAINAQRDFSTQAVLGQNRNNVNNLGYSNFKMFKQEFIKNIQQIITPVFYQIQQKYTDKFVGISLEQEILDNSSYFYMKGKSFISSFKITTPGFSKVNIDITYQKNNVNIDSKRITLEPQEFEAGLLTDLLEQFILEYKKDV